MSGRETNPLCEEVLPAAILWQKGLSICHPVLYPVFALCEEVLPAVDLQQERLLICHLVLYPVLRRGEEAAGDARYFVLACVYTNNS